MFLCACARVQVEVPQQLAPQPQLLAGPVLETRSRSHSQLLEPMDLSLPQQQQQQQLLLPQWMPVMQHVPLPESLQASQLALKLQALQAMQQVCGGACGDRGQGCGSGAARVHKCEGTCRETPELWPAK